MTSYVLGGGCFWCLDATYRQLKGVSSVESGYAGGEGEPSYARVSSGKTGYAEVVQVTFDETAIPSDVILDIFFLIHDPTTLNQQGADIGRQYRSIMFYGDEHQAVTFRDALERAQKIWEKPIVTEIEALTTYYVAEEEHQDFFNRHPESSYCSVVITPKISALRAAYKKWLKEEA
jgi:peptide-methionine (S)-S-oxide reductase